MMSSRHVIDECRVELRFRHERQALATQGVWETFVRERLLAVAEAVFDEVSEPGEIRRLESLSIDVGSADPQTGGREVERRMREQLHAALGAQDGQIVRGTGSPAPAAGRVLTRAASDLAQLQQFLQSGQLPWHSRHRTQGAFDALVRRVLETNAVAFAQWLREVESSPFVFPRLVRQFPEDMLEAVGALLLPGQVIFLGALARQLSLLFADTREGTVAAAGLNRMVWEALLGAVLERGHSALGDARLLREAVKRLARLRGGSDAGTAATLRNAMARLRAANEPAFDVGGAWRALRRATAPDRGEVRAADGAAAIADSTSQLAAAGAWRHLSQALERAVMRGDAMAVHGLWHSLLRQHVPMVIGVVRRNGVLAKVRRRMAEGFPETMLQDIVHLLEPLHSQFIAEFVHRHDLFQPATGGQVLASGALRVRTWEFTLTYLLVERGSGFNKEAYLGSVVRQMAAHHNLGYRQLLGALAGVMEDVTTGGILHGQMLTLLRQLEQRADAAENDGLDGPSSSADMVQGASAYSETADHVLYGRRVAGVRADALSAGIERLASAYPAQFIRLVREFEASLPSAARIAAGLPVAALRQLVYAVLALEYPRGDAAFLAFRTALDRNVLQMPNPQNHLAQVLMRLLTRQRVDLDALALSQDSSETPAQAEPRSNADVVKTAARRRLQVLLEDWIGGEPVAVVAPAWDELVREYPQVLQSVLRRRGRSEQARREMANRATEPMLRDIVRVLEPAHSAFIDEIMQHPDWLRGETALPMANTERGKRRLWAFTLGYLLVDRGGQFNKKAFLGSLIRQIAAHDNLGAADFVHALVRELGRAEALKSRPLEMFVLLRMIAAEIGAPTALAGKQAALPATLPAASGTAAARSTRVSRGQLKVLLHDWIDGGPVNAIAPVWGELVRGSPALLRSVLRERGRFESARRNMAYSATESMLRDAVHVLEPEHGGFVDDIMHHTELFRGRITTPGPDTGQDSRRLWAFTLAYLLVDRGGQFNKKSYLASLIRRMAAHDNLSAQDLVRALFAAVGNGAATGALGVEMLNLLRALAAESGYVLPYAGYAEGTALETALAGSGALCGERRERLIQTIERQLVSAPAALRRCLADLLQEWRATRRLVASLSESLLARVLALLCPAGHTRALRCADIIATTWILSLSSDESSRAVRTLEQPATRNRPSTPGKPVGAKIKRWKWQCVFRYLIVEGRTFDEERFARYCLADLQGRCAERDAGRLQERLIPHLARSGTPADRERMDTIAMALSGLATARGRHDPLPSPALRRRTLPRVRDAAAPVESLHVTNAGQVLATPYLPQLFTMLQLTADGKFNDARAAHRAVHLLQFMVDGSTDTPEPLLTLNKILCGVPIGEPVAREVFLTDRERQTVEDMIRGMIQNWSAIGSTSVAGFRESFLQREGRLNLKDESWHLLVEPRAFDMLLDRIPWGYATIKHAWMRHIVHVDWR